MELSGGAKIEARSDWSELGAGIGVVSAMVVLNGVVSRSDGAMDSCLLPKIFW